ncbi:MAG: MFS transporter [Anaerolineae bacterium]|nr:MFS transporter [Anaerolineae bacterium]
MNTYYALLKNRREFRILWTAQVISLAGDWFNTIASVVILSRLTDSGAGIGLLFVTRAIPPFLLGPVAGVLADRFDRRTIMVMANYLRAVIVLGFLLVLYTEQAWLIYVLTLLQFGVSAFFEPARSAIAPSLVHRDEIVSANTLSSATWSTMLTLGAAVGGIVTGLFGPAVALIIDALTFVVAGILTQQLGSHRAEGAAHHRTSGLRDFKEGLVYLWTRPGVALPASVKAMQQVGNIDILFALYALQVFRVGQDGATTLGTLYAAHGVGSITGPLIADAIGDRSARYLQRAITVGYVLIPIGWLIFGLAPALWVAVLAMFIRGMGGSINWTYSSALLQIRVPGSFLGRVTALDFAFFTLALAISAWLPGVVQDAFGVQPRELVIGIAALSLISLGVWLLASRAQTPPADPVLTVE